ncbi:MAG: HEPN domain-containing protein [Bryobacterales bacterium]|nr:HEPN domain-containing protein [Bryobacterales bacterium]
MPNRSGDWFRPAERGLKQAQVPLDARPDDRAFFAGHQAAEKAVKALHLSAGQEVRGRRIAPLLRQFRPDAARGPGSDVDPVIAAERSDRPFHRRSIDFDTAGLPVPAGIVVYTPSELEALAGLRFGQVLSAGTVRVYERR